MQLPKRRHELLKTYEEESQPLLLTQGGINRLKQELTRLEDIEVKQAVKDVAETGAMGDRSENAEYQEARHRLSRLQHRIFALKERLKRVAVISKPRQGSVAKVALGSTVVVDVGQVERSYQIVGPSESSPSHGRISHLSPLGSALMGHTIGETVEIETPNGRIHYLIKTIS